jgi:hypothetical protein
MKYNKWTLALAAAGVVSLGAAAQAEESANPVMTAVSNTTLSGYVDTSAIWQMGSQAGKFNSLPGRSFDGANKMDGFNLNVAKLSLEKPLDASTWAAGYKLDLLFGPDANAFATTSTLGVNQTGTSDFAVQQAYVALRAPVGNGLDFKMGVWNTIIGYEVFDAGNNPNYSRSYGYFLEPKVHTGVLATYQFTEWLSVAGGIANTEDSIINGRAHAYNPNAGTPDVATRAESEKTYVGSVALTAPESMGFLKGGTLYGGVVEGQPTGGTFSDIVNLYVGATIPTPLTGLSVGAAYDYRGTSSKDEFYNPVTQAGRSTYANAAAGYLVYRASEKLTLANRFEYAWWSQNNEALMGGPGVGFQSVMGETITADYKLWEPVITRLEFRWDRATDGSEPFGSGQENNLQLALNVIYKF